MARGGGTWAGWLTLVLSMPDTCAKYRGYLC